MLHNARRVKHSRCHAKPSAGKTSSPTAPVDLRPCDRRPRPLHLAMPLSASSTLQSCRHNGPTTLLSTLDIPPRTPIIDL